MITKAVIPVAGRGTRMRSVGGDVPKGLLPLPGAGGSSTTVLCRILLEAASAGIERVGVIVSPDRAAMFEQHLAGLGSCERAALPPVEWIVQPAPAGFGDAVARARDFTGEAPFLLMLGDHVYASPAGAPGCAAQVTAAFAARAPAAMIGVQVVGEDQLGSVGVCRGEPLPEGRGGQTSVYRCTGFREKPGAGLAARELVTPGLPAGRYLAHGGLYAFTPEIYVHLAGLRPAAGAEVELAAAQLALLVAHPRDYLLARIVGTVWDVGNPAGYAAAAAAMQGPAR